MRHVVCVHILKLPASPVVKSSQMSLSSVMILVSIAGWRTPLSKVAHNPTLCVCVCVCVCVLYYAANGIRILKTVFEYSYT